MRKTFSSKNSSKNTPSANDGFFFTQKTKAILYLENGDTFTGYAPKWLKGNYQGEVVFNTGMTGYPESLTDPSYQGQILTFTYPLIGNYGVPPKKFFESKKIWTKAIIVNEFCQHPSHPHSIQPLLKWLEEENCPVLFNIDTRALTKLLRKYGTMKGIISLKKGTPHAFESFNNEHMVSKVSCKEVIRLGSGKKKIVVIDCGIKENILRHLLSFPLTIYRVPYNYDFTSNAFPYEYDGIFISNGPGDPQECKETISIIKKAFQMNKPTFGICLGTQLMALANGAKTYKLPFGHRGHNQPCIDLKSDKCYITSQNHGYAIKDQTLPKEWIVSFRNLNDHSIEGIQHKKKPFFGVQFHPEAAPGPTDSTYLFERFYQLL